MVWIGGGSFQMGSDRHYPEEAPAHPVAVDGFWIDRTAVTNAQFQKFVKATGHRTLAERPADPSAYPEALPELLQPASIVFVPPPRPIGKGDPYQWWRYVAGANWRHPEGPGSSIKGREQHPVVHIAFEDALAYAAWIGKGLPTEAEWEWAARGGLAAAEYAWGEELHPAGRMLANTWQGDFPHHNSGADGWEGTAPVGSYPANGYGLLDMIGNVWEWTDDWYQEHRARLASEAEGCCNTWQSPRRPGPGQQHRPQLPARQHPPQGGERRVVPVRPQLLPPLPACGADGPGGRHLHLPSGLPLHRAAPAPTMNPPNRRAAAGYSEPG
jgi:formylglycine-generating enzyme required for sulfatase activity